MLESTFRDRLVIEIQDLFPEAKIILNDPRRTQGIHDLLILYHDTYAVLECKRSRNSPRRPNQEYYVDLFSKWVYSTFVYPENKERVLDELQQAFRNR